MRFALQASGRNCVSASGPRRSTRADPNSIAPNMRVSSYSKDGVIQHEDGSRIRAGRAIEAKLSRHTEMNRETALIEIDEDELAVPAHILDAAARAERAVMSDGECRVIRGCRTSTDNDVPSTKTRRSSRTIVSTSGSSGMQIDAVSVNGHASGRDIAAITGTGAAVELPRVPGTHDCVLMQERHAPEERRDADRFRRTRRSHRRHCRSHSPARLALTLRHAPGRQSDNTPDAYRYHYR